MKLRLTLTILPLIILVVVALVTAKPVINSSKLQVDISWPQCKVKNLKQYSNGIIGVTNGLNFSSNPCLARESNAFANYEVYINSGYPGLAYGKEYKNSPLNCKTKNNYCYAYNWGYNSVLYAIKYADLSAVRSTVWWIDVESDNSWLTNSYINRQSILGAINAIQQKVPFSKTGIYSYPGQWNVITANWKIGLPAWVATGALTRQPAVIACNAPAFTGGQVVYSQYTKALDQDIVCSE